MAALAEAVRVLGLETGSARRSRTQIDYLDMVDQGLPTRSLDLISSTVAPNDNGFKYRIVPKASLARSKATNRLSPGHSMVVARLASIWGAALRVWKSEDEARDFLNRPHPLLGSRRPIDLVLENEMGADLVRDALGRLEYGSAV